MSDGVIVPESNSPRVMHGPDKGSDSLPITESPLCSKEKNRMREREREKSIEKKNTNSFLFSFLMVFLISKFPTSRRSVDSTSLPAVGTRRGPRSYASFYLSFFRSLRTGFSRPYTHIPSSHPDPPRTAHRFPQKKKKTHHNIFRNLSNLCPSNSSLNPRQILTRLSRIQKKNKNYSTMRIVLKILFAMKRKRRK